MALLEGSYYMVVQKEMSQEPEQKDRPNPRKIKKENKRKIKEEESEIPHWSYPRFNKQ